MNWILVEEELPDKELIEAGAEDEYPTDQVIIQVKYKNSISVSTGFMFNKEWYWWESKRKPISQDFKVIKWQWLPDIE